MFAKRCNDCSEWLKFFNLTTSTDKSKIDPVAQSTNFSTAWSIVKKKIRFLQDKIILISNIFWCIS